MTHHQPRLTGTFEAFYSETSGRLLRYAYGLTGDMAEAQDLTQEAYVRAWQRWKRLRDYDNPESWVRLVVTRLATDRWRWLRTRRQAAAGDSALVVDGPGEDLVMLVAELKRLPVPQRRALVLHYLLDCPVADIAEETGVSVNTVKSWLLRGRANLAAQLFEATAQPAEAAARLVLAEDIAKTGRKRQRRRSTLRSIVAFLTTAAATSAYFLVFQAPEPTPIGPDLILPYGGRPQFADAVVDSQRAYLTWRQIDGRAKAAVIDLKHSKPIGPPLDLGLWNETFAVIGTGSAGVYLYGINASDSAVFAIDPGSGKLLWQHHFKTNFDDRPMVLRDTVVVVEHGPIDRIVTVLDARSGKPRWTSDQPVAAVPFQHDDNRLVLLYRDGVLQVRDMTTGRLQSQRSGPPPNGANHWVIGDFVYQSGNVLYRTPLTGDRPPETIAGIGNAILAQCGPNICVAPYGADEVILLDSQSGRQMRRLKAQMSGAPQFSARGMIFRDGPIVRSPRVYDYDGVDITPATLVEGSAQWAGDDHLLLTRVHGPANITLPSDGPVMVSPDSTADMSTALQAGLSIYSFMTGQETPLGEVVLRGGCGAAHGTYLCPTDIGFTLYH